jgi:recombination protein RecR
MSQQYPSRLLEQAVSEISKLPGIGRKTALRLVLHMLRRDAKEIHALSNSLTTLVNEVKYCHTCHNISDKEECDICANPQRDKTTICVVENIQNVMAIENTGQFRGLYHVLGGVISPMDGIHPSDLEIESLLQRVKQGGVREIVLALSPTTEGDTTSYYIARKLADAPVTLTTIARGVAIGDELQYADELTLGKSITNRVPYHQ